ncbi:MAG TPA: hypothetical protein VF796_25185 [Humisphaera sp.]
MLVLDPRLDAAPDGLTPERAPSGRVIVARSPRTPPELTRALAEVLRDPRSFDVSRGFEFVPGHYGSIVVRLGRGDVVLDLELDTDYDLVLGTASSGVPSLEPDGRRPVSFAPARGALVPLLRRAFPGRPELVGLATGQERVARDFGSAAVAVLLAPERVECVRIAHKGTLGRPEFLRWKRTLRLFDRGLSQVSYGLPFSTDEVADALTPPPPNGTIGPDRPDRYEVVCRRPLDGPLGRDVAAAVLDPTTHRGVPAVSCFNPGLVYRFEHSGRAVEAYVCLECGRVQFALIGFGDSGTRSRPIEFMSSAGVARMAALATRTFPEDPAFRPGTRSADE